MLVSVHALLHAADEEAIIAQAATTHSGAMTTHLLNLTDLEAEDWHQFRHEWKFCPPSAEVAPFFASMEWQWQTPSAGVLLNEFLKARALPGKPDVLHVDEDVH